MRWLAGFVVVLGCGYIGLVLASLMDTRIHQIEELESIFQQLAFNIGFLTLPLAESLRQAARTQRGAVAHLFGQMAEEMAGHPEQSPRQIFEIMEERTEGLWLKEPELDAIRDFMTRAGKSDRQQTLDGIHLTIAKLKLARESALSRRERDGKMCRGLGFLTGMLIVLVLL